MKWKRVVYSLGNCPGSSRKASWTSAAIHAGFVHWCAQLQFCLRSIGKILNLRFIALAENLLTFAILRPVSRKFQKHFGPGKSFVKVRPAYFVKLVFTYVVKGIKIKITAKFRSSRLLHLEDTKRIISPEMRPKSLGTLKKRNPGACFSKVPKLFGPISATTNPYLRNTEVLGHQTSQSS